MTNEKFEGHLPTVETQASFEIDGPLPDVTGKVRDSYPDEVLTHFEYGHLPEPLQRISRSFAELAERLVKTVPRCEQRSIALQRLLEAKDAAVRAGRLA